MASLNLFIECILSLLEMNTIILATHQIATIPKRDVKNSDDSLFNFITIKKQAKKASNEDSAKKKSSK